MARKKTVKSIETIDGKAKVSRSKKVKEIDQVHGKVEEDIVSQTVRKSEALDQILGMRQKNPFSARNIEDFQSFLQGKNLTDLREIAVGAGIFPSGNATVLRKKLIKGFEDFIKGGSSQRPSIPINDSSKFPDSDLQSRINNIWSNKN
jgi:hypothetical protein